MNALPRTFSLAALVLSTFLAACIQEAPKTTDDPAPADTDTDSVDCPPGYTQSGSLCIEDADDDTDDTDTTPPETSSDAAYTQNGGELEIGHDANPYPGSRIGLFADGAGVEDGWTRAVATVVQDDEGNLTVNLNLFGEGDSIRWALATINDDNEPLNWLWESGTIANNLVDGDDDGLTMWLQECVGDVLVDKLNFCTRNIESGGEILIESGDCWGTYVEPESCEDADNDGDVDPDTTGDGTDSGTDEDADTVDNDGDGYSEAEGDCDDGYRYSYPGAPEYYDGADQDCDGVVDNGCESDDAWNEYCD